MCPDPPSFSSFALDVVASKVECRARWEMPVLHIMWEGMGGRSVKDPRRRDVTAEHQE